MDPKVKTDTVDVTRPQACGVYFSLEAARDALPEYTLISHSSVIQKTRGLGVQQITRFVTMPHLNIIVEVAANKVDELVVSYPTNLKLTPDYVKGKATEDEQYFNHGTYTICSVTAENGAKLVGTSGVIHPEYNIPELGRDIAHQNAVNKLWELEGYHRMSMLTYAGINPNQKD
ncbi:hypothetical protein GR11A_00225 [Vibrio phage vB_VcorM_GR11A]|nr:hypothetical protein GR11A_00225 [Vibrio phage vB_VcorM_GR11A]